MLNRQQPTRWHRFLVGTLAVASIMTGSDAQNDRLESCLAAIQRADGSDNNRLSKDEYVAFLNDITNGDYGFETYESLPDALLMNFEIYEESGGVIDIRGVTLESANKRQKRVVQTLCETTDMAIAVVPVSDTRSSGGVNNTASINNNATSLSINATNQTLYTYPNGSGSPLNYPYEMAPNSQSEPTAQNVSSSSLNSTAAVQTNSSGTVSLENYTADDLLPVNGTGQVNPPTTLEPSMTASQEEVMTNAPDTNTATPNATATSSPSMSSSNSDAVPLSNQSQPSVSTVSPPSGLNSTVPPTVPNATIPPTDATSSPTPPIEANATSTTTEPNITTTGSSASNLTAAPTDTSTSMPPNSTVASISNMTNATEASDGDSIPSTLTQSPSVAVTTDDFSECKRVMRFSDIDEDGFMNKIEYVWFLNDNWNNLYPGVAFKDLPQELKDNFFSFASENQIDIAMLNSEDPMSNDQEEFLDRICAETEAAIALEASGDTTSEEAVMNTFKECLVSVTLVDDNGDSWLEQTEYVSMINELSKGDFGKGSFENLPDMLQDNFYALSISTRIDLGGAKHDVDLSSSQQEILENICIETSYALEEAYKSIGEEDTFDTVDTDTMLEYAACFMGMNEHDRNQDLLLDADEYVGLVNLMGKYRFQNLPFEQLPLVLQDNFLNLQTNGTINIDGSQEGQVPDSAQQHFLGEVCIETTAAVNMAIAMGVEYSETTPPNPMPERDPIVIHSSFNIYSDVWIAGEEFIMGVTRDKLAEAYRQFVMEVVDGLKQDNGERRSVRHRRLQEMVEATIRRPLAVLDRDSPSIDHIVDLNCAGASDGAICKTVFATYEITPMEDDMDREGLYGEYVRVTQSFIDGGLLQSALERVDPDSLITVIGASEPVAFTTEAPTRPPLNSGQSTNDDDYEERMEDNKKKTIALIAVGVGCLLVASLIGLIAVRYRKYKAANAATASQAEASDADKSVGKASDTASKEDELHQEGSQGSGSGVGMSSASTGSGHSSRIFRSRLGGETDSDDDVVLNDEELGKMQVIDLAPCEGINAATNDFEAISQAHFRNLARQQQGQEEGSAASSSRASVPPLRKKHDEQDSAASEELSFAFRRYAIDGGKKKKKAPAESGDRYGI